MTNAYSLFLYSISAALWILSHFVDIGSEVWEGLPLIYTIVLVIAILIENRHIRSVFLDVSDARAEMFRNVGKSIFHDKSQVNEGEVRDMKVENDTREIRKDN